MAEFTVHPGATSMIQDNVFHDREAKPRASGLTRAGLIDSVKTLEQSGQMLRGNPGTEVTNIKFDFACPLDRTDFNFFAARCIFQSIVYQVRKHLMDSFFVGENFEVLRKIHL